MAVTQDNYTPREPLLSMTVIEFNALRKCAGFTGPITQAERESLERTLIAACRETNGQRQVIISSATLNAYRRRIGCTEVTEQMIQNMINSGEVDSEFPELD